jgi:hypothetical protein
MMRKSMLALLAAWTLVACKQADQPKSPPGSKVTTMADVTSELTSLGYEGLFLQPTPEHANRIWGDAGTRQRLLELIRSEQQDTQARFLAAELHFRRDPGFPEPGDRVTLARVYGAALAQDLAGIGNVWGLPGGKKGLVGEHVVRLGDAAVPVLRELLDDDRELMFEGSEEATLADMFHVRVKDVAAWLISEIRGWAYEGAQEPGMRDASIEALEKKL